MKRFTGGEEEDQTDDLQAAGEDSNEASADDATFFLPKDNSAAGEDSQVSLSQCGRSYSIVAFSELLALIA